MVPYSSHHKKSSYYIDTVCASSDGVHESVHEIALSATLAAYVEVKHW